VTATVLDSRAFGEAKPLSKTIHTTTTPRIQVLERIAHALEVEPAATFQPNHRTYGPDIPSG
jgi:hypothetical protein